MDRRRELWDEGMTEQLTGYRHEAFPYAGHDEFVTSTAAFLREGVANCERAIVVAVGEKLSDVRDELGGDAHLVSFVDMAVAGRNPARILSLFQQFIDADPGGRRLRAIGEPIHPRRSSEEVVEAQLHELLLNSPRCQSWDVWLGCPYDVGTLADDVLAAMRASHPFIAGEPDQPGDRVAMAQDMFATELPPAPSDAHILRTGHNGLAGARAFVRTEAAAAGLGADKVYNLVFAVNEIVSNSLRYADATADLAVWRGDCGLYCDVRDGGVISDVLVGRMSPAPLASRGRGVWLANHFCDLVQVRSSVLGTVVRMRVDI